MLRAGGSAYRVCLLDTNALSEIVRTPESRELRGFLEWAMSSEPYVIPAFNVFALLELRRDQELFRRFIDVFTNLPIVMVKAMEDLLAAELAAYQSGGEVDFVSLVFTPLGGPAQQMSTLPSLLDRFSGKESAWNEGRFGLVKSLAGQARAAREQDSAIGPDDADLFVMASSLQVLAELETTRQFVLDQHQRGRAVSLDAFPSVRAMAYTVFHKFYEDPRRRPTNSDGFDILIASSLPYVDAVITEAHQAEVIRKVSRRDAFLDPLEVLTLRDLRRLTGT